MSGGWARVPLVPLALALGAGIVIAPHLPVSLVWAIWLGGVVTAVIALAVRHLVLASAALLATVLALGALRVAPSPLPPDHVARVGLPARAVLVGRIAATPLPSPGRLRLLIDVDTIDDEPRSGRVQLTAYGDAPELVIGQRVRVDSRLSAPVGFRNPGGFDYVAQLALGGVHVVGSTRAETIVTLDAPDPPWHTRVRTRAVAAIDGALPPASAALLAGLILGERRGLPPEIDEGFRRAGVYHVLAVSGFNVALVSSTVFVLARLSGLGRRRAASASIVVVIAFGAVVGPQASVLRAVVMAVLVLAALLLDRDTEIVNSLAAAALVILAFRPHDLSDPGFQLSFAATAGIVLAPHPRNIVLGALMVSVAAQAAVLPITLWHFHQVSMAGVLANLAAVPLAAVATIVGLAGAVLALASDVAAQVVFDAVWPALLALRAVVAMAARLPGALLYLPSPPPAAIACYAVALLLGVLAWRLRRERPRFTRGASTAGVVLSLASVALSAWPLVQRPDGRLRITVLDVGQGDAIVVEGPDGRAVVIDAGRGGPGRLDTGERVVAPYLWWRGFLRLAATAVTHEDADHAGGMAAVRTRFPGAEVWTAATLADGPRRLGDAVITALPGGVGPRRNDRALVVRVDFGAASFLLASDIPGIVERALVARGAPLAATVLKVSHHGARDGSTPAFLEAVRPRVAVISVGTRNPYHHPHPGVIERLDAAGARVLRTDRDGAVLFETDGRTVTVTTWASGVHERWCVDPEAMC